MKQHVGTIRRHLPAVADVIMGQFVVQAVMAASGFLLVRNLSKTDYALFSVYSAVSAMMTVLADSGLAAGVNSRGGEIAQEGKARLASLWKTSHQFLCRQWALGGAVIGGLGLWLLARLGCPPPMSVGILCAGAVGMIFSTKGLVNTAVCNLLGKRREVQWSLISGQVVRFLIIVTCWPLGLLNLPVAIASAMISALILLYVIRDPIQLAVTGTADPADKDHLVRCMRHSLPNSFFVCVQGQLATLMLGAFGKTDSVAELGALSRIGVLFAVIGAPVLYLAAPVFAQSKSRRHLLKVVTFTVLSYLAAGSLVLTIVFFWPQPFLWILGSNYSGLGQELLWVVVMHLIAMMENIVWTVAVCRAWLSGAWIVIPAALVSQGLFLFFVNPGTISGALTLGIVQSLAKCSVAIVLVVKGLRQLESDGAKQ